MKAAAKRGALDLSPKLRIETGIPIPGRNEKEGRISATLRSLNEGDSFVMPEGYASSTIYVESKRLKIKVTRRKLPDGRFRVWRIA